MCITVWTTPISTASWCLSAREAVQRFRPSREWTWEVAEHASRWLVVGFL